MPERRNAVSLSITPLSASPEPCPATHSRFIDHGWRMWIIFYVAPRHDNCLQRGYGRNCPNNTGSRGLRVHFWKEGIAQPQHLPQWIDWWYPRLSGLPYYHFRICIREESCQIPNIQPFAHHSYCISPHSTIHPLLFPLKSPACHQYHHHHHPRHHFRHQLETRPWGALVLHTFYKFGNNHSVSLHRGTACWNCLCHLQFPIRPP